MPFNVKIHISFIILLLLVVKIYFYRQVVFNEYTTESKIDKNLGADEDELETTNNQMIMNRINSIYLDKSQINEDLCLK